MTLTRIELQKEEMKFAAGHFTIFSATERENLHGHNFTVGVVVDAEVGDDGLAFDYGIYKRRVIDLCRSLHETFLLPGDSPHLVVDHDDTHVHARFAGETLSFLRRDVTVLPVRNVTVEELSRWAVERLTEDPAELERLRIRRLEVRLFSGPGQSASSLWTAGGAAGARA